MLSQLLRWWQPSPRVPAPAIWAGCLTLRRENMKFGAAWRKGHLWMLSASEVFSFLPQEAGACRQPGCVWAAASPSDGALPSCCGAQKAHSSALARYQQSAEVSGAMKTHSSRKSTPLCFLCPPCSPIIFIIFCFETDLLITQFLQALLPSSTESKSTRTINKQPKIGRTRSRLYMPLAGEAVCLVEAIYKQH